MHHGGIDPPIRGLHLGEKSTNHAGETDEMQDEDDVVDDVHGTARDGSLHLPHARGSTTPSRLHRRRTVDIVGAQPPERARA